MEFICTEKKKAAAAGDKVVSSQIVSGGFYDPFSNYYMGMNPYGGFGNPLGGYDSMLYGAMADQMMLNTLFGGVWSRPQAKKTEDSSKEHKDLKDQIQVLRDELKKRDDAVNAEKKDSEWKKYVDEKNKEMVKLIESMNERQKKLEEIIEKNSGEENRILAMIAEQMKVSNENTALLQKRIETLEKKPVNQSTIAVSEIIDKVNQMGREMKTQLVRQNDQMNEKIERMSSRMDTEREKVSSRLSDLTSAVSHMSMASSIPRTPGTFGGMSVSIPKSDDL
jgi:hypothetical protein